MKQKRCPKCKQAPVYYTELWKDTVIEFDIVDGEISEQGICNPGQPYGVEALCRCGHKWKLKGVSQIGDIR